MTRERYGHRKTDHYKKAPNVHHAINELAWKHEIRREEYQRKHYPSDMQVKYMQHLIQLCADNGIEHNYSGDYDSANYPKQYVEKVISQLINKLDAAGIDWSNPHKRKYKFDKKGNVVEIATGKVVKKRV